MAMPVFPTLADVPTAIPLGPNEVAELPTTVELGPKTELALLPIVMELAPALASLPMAKASSKLAVAL